MLPTMFFVINFKKFEGLKRGIIGGPIMNGTAKFFLEILFKYRTNAKRPRSVYSIFHFFACGLRGLFKKSVYLANLLSGWSASC